MSAKTKVLVVDDSEIVLESTRAALTLAGYDVETHRGPKGGTAAVRNAKADVVLLDLGEHAEGEYIARCTRAATSLKQPVILIFSAQEEAKLALAAKRCGADGYIPKTDARLLARDLARALGASARRAAQ